MVGLALLAIHEYWQEEEHRSSIRIGILAITCGSHLLHCCTM